ncbi:mucin-5AC isoform X2 [Drosophila erecta]|nr:mucin-5AC isoform X2 [Drosophila erecta]
MTQKRKENESGMEGKPNKKRHMQQPHPQQPHLPAAQQQQQQQLNPTSSAGVEEADPVPPEKRLTPRTLQQRYFYQQQIKHKQRLASKRNLSNSLGSPSAQAGSPLGGRNMPCSGAEPSAAKRIAAPAKSGRRAQKQLQQQLQQKLQHHQQQKVLMQVQETVPNHMVVQPHVEYVLDEALKTLAASTPPTPTSTATSPYTILNEPRPLVTLKPLKTIKPVIYGPQSSLASAEIGSPTTPASRGFANSPIVFKEKLQATPVQVSTQGQGSPTKKFVAEERHSEAVPAAATAATTPISTANLPLAPQIISVQKIPAPSMGGKLRAAVASPTSSANSTLLPPGAKTTPKKFNILEGDAKPKTLPSSAVRLLPYTEPIGTPLSPLKDSRVHSSSASTVNIIKNIPASSLNNTLITPLPSAGTTMPANLFRAKVTPPIKGASGAAGGAAVIGAAGATGIGGAGAGPQILGNIKLTSSSGGAATIKQVPSSALRNIKICSPNGKLFLQPGKLPAGSIIHKFNNASSTAVSAAGGVVTTTTTVSPTNLAAREQRISIQKILQPATGSASSGSSSPTTTTTTISGLTSSAKQPSLGSKPTTLTFATAGGGKNNLVFLPASAASGMRALTLATKPKSNVLVIGASTSPAPTTSSSGSSPNPSGGTKPKANQLITEDTPIDIINMPIIVADNGTAAELNQASVKNSPLVVFNATDWEMELDQAATKLATTTSKQALDDVIIEEDEDTEEEAGERSEQPSAMDLNNSIIELHPEDDSAIEYVDMDLEQPIEIESTSNISPETATTTLKAAIVSTSPQQQKQKQKPLEHPLEAAGTGSSAGAATQ